MSTFSLFLAVLWCLKPLAVIVPIVYFAEKNLFQEVVD